MVTSRHAEYCGSQRPIVSSRLSFPAAASLRISAAVNALVLLPI